jgi:preprotein translocase subunit YajC
MLATYLVEAGPPAKSAAGGFNPTFLLLIILAVGVFFMMSRSNRRRQAQAQQKMNSVEPGVRVRTTAGMYATVVSVDGDDVVLEVAPGVEVKYMKRAIMDVVPEEEPVTDFAAAPTMADVSDDAAADEAGFGHAEFGEPEDTATQDDADGDVTDPSNVKKD